MYFTEESRQQPVRARDDGTRLAAAIASELTTDDYGNAVVPPYKVFLALVKLLLIH
jgi:hypothetical protein